MNTHPVYIIQGAQWGSEGKGQIAALYAQHKSASAVVRTGSINAGHTVYHGQNPKPYKMQLLPTAWTVGGPKLVLGPGCYIHREILTRETEMVNQATNTDIREYLLIDYRCTLHTAEHEERAHASNRHHEMGATGKGSSDAVIERMTARGRIPDAKRLLFASDPVAGKWDFSRCICDTTEFLHQAVQEGPIILEGTQGAHLDVYTGPYPYTTNRAVSTAAWLAYSGLPPTLDIRPVLVARTYPIRVAGNSGPMPGETTWPNLYMNMTKYAKHLERPHISLSTLCAYEIALREIITTHGGPDESIACWSEEERFVHRALLSEAPTQALQKLSAPRQEQLLAFFEKTTVTNKVRRVATLDLPMLKEAIRWNGCHEMWITFLNYEFPSLWGATDASVIREMAGTYLKNLSDQLDVRIFGVSTERKPEHHVII